MKRSAQTVFRGLHPEAFRFFRRLARNNHKPWFDRHRALYDLHVVGALKGLFEALVPVVLALDAGFEISGKTGRNFSRINRDIRFARDKSPYRSNRYLYFGRRGSPQFDARLYVGLSGDGVTCGFAAYNGHASALALLLKPRRAKDPARLDKFLRHLARPIRASRYESYWHGVERGEWKKYPGNPKTDKDWKRCKAWVVRQRFASGRREVRSPQFAKTVAKIFRELFPLYAFSALEGRTGEQALQRAGRQ